MKQTSMRPLNRLTIFGTADERTIAQMENCLAVEEGAIGVLCADNHLGYSQPIGAAVAYREHISPSGVGFDIGCGNKSVLTNMMTHVVDIPEIVLASSNTRLATLHYNSDF